ncbi:MAG: PKD domain-containing protein, partial [Paludibacter sp.]|nr:PKD domain-containing protein [Paludibacter sp.]
AAPVASFTASIDASNYLKINIANTSVEEPGTSWFWEFGDGQTSTEKNPASHSYSEAGTYTVTLRTFNTYGESVATQEVELGKYIFNSSETANWESESNWNTSSLPDASAEVLIQGNAVINTPVTVGGITVAAGKSLTVAAAGSLSADAITLKSTATDGTATFIDAGNASISIVNVEQYLSGANGSTNRNHWYISSPVNDITAQMFAPLNVNWLYYYNENTHSWSDDITNESEYLSAGRGYVFANNGNDSVFTFSGNIRSGNVIVNVTRTGKQDLMRGYNLIGNPYPSYLEWDAVNKENVLPTIWTRSMQGTDMVFLTYNAEAEVGVPDETTEHIAPMQSFWVKVKPELADSAGRSIIFSSSMRSHRQSGYGTLRTPQFNDRQIIRLTLSNGIKADQAAILFTDRASNALDDFDSEKMTAGNITLPEISTLAGSTWLAINGLNAVSTDLEIPIGIKIGTAGEFTINANEISNIAQTVILKDKLLDNEFTLTGGSTYQFTSTTANNAERFSIIFRTPNDVSLIDEKPANIYISGGKLIIENGQADAMVEIFDILGRKLYEKTLNAQFSILNPQLQTGVYLVKIGNKTTKIIVK